MPDEKMNRLELGCAYIRYVRKKESLLLGWGGVPPGFFEEVHIYSSIVTRYQLFTCLYIYISSVRERAPLPSI